MQDQRAGTSRVFPEQPIRPAKRVSTKIPAEGEDGKFTEGWFAIAMSSEVSADDIVGKDFLDGKVIVFRAEDGSARVTSGYCPHMGADLSGGEKTGGLVRCPFHRFEFDGEGRCVKTAYGAPPPPTARLYVFPTIERYGLIWAWNGEEAPAWDLPDFDYPDEELHFEVQEFGVFPADPYVTCCNTPDYHHYRSVHGLDWEHDDPDPRKTIRWTDHSFTFDIEGTHWNDRPMEFTFGIYATSLYYQQGTLDGRWYGFLAPFRVLRPQKTLTYFVIATHKGDGSAAAPGDAEAWAKEAMQLEIDFVNQDVPLLDGAHFMQGALTRKDEATKMYLDLVRSLPRSHPSKDFIQ